MTFKNFQEAILDTTKTTAMIFLIIATALVLCNFLGISRIPNAASEFIMNLKVHRTVILAGVMILYIIAGCFMDMTSFENPLRNPSHNFRL